MAIQLIEIIFSVYFSYTSFYTFILSLAGRIGKKEASSGHISFHRVAILIPAFKEDGVILDVANSYNNLDYPSHQFDVFVISDSMKKETILQLKKIVNVIEVSFEVSTKVKSLNKALSEIGDDYDIVVINDADNIPESNFLKRISFQFSKGNKAIQGQRMAKNTNTPFAILDAISEMINNHIYRKGFNALRLSSGLIGSGMAFEIHLLKKLLLVNQAVGGFDKVLQLSIVERGIFIKYDEEAIVFDEKTESSGTFRKQRKRWLSSQLKYFFKSFKTSFAQLFKGNLNYFNLAFLATIMQPRILVFAVLTFFCILSSIIRTDFIWGWWMLFAIYISAMILSIPSYYYQKPFFLALIRIPVLILNLLLALFGVKNSDKAFIHTDHQTKGVQNIFYEKWKRSNQ